MDTQEGGKATAIQAREPNRLKFTARTVRRVTPRRNTKSAFTLRGRCLMPSYAIEFQAQYNPARPPRLSNKGDLPFAQNTDVTSVSSVLHGFDPTLLLVLNLVGTFVFGLSRGLAAAQARLDAFGVVVLAVVVALAVESSETC